MDTPANDSKPAGAARQSPRLTSIDALRGFDMFWIIGGNSLFKALGTWLGYPLLVTQMQHAGWEGFRFYDLIFPLFLFIVGVVLPFSLSKYASLNGGTTNRGQAYFRILRRAVLLIALGLVYNRVLQLDFTDFRWAGVLQRIGLCYFFAALIVLHFGVRTQAILFLGILVGYWALLRFVPAPGFSPFDLTKEGNLAGYVDRLFLPGRLLYKFGDNEGLLTTLPAIATTLLGALAGAWLRTSRSASVKWLGLVVAAVVCLGAGYAWSAYFPLIKILWTSSYVLVTGGWSLALLALFYLIIDMAGWQRWAFFFIVIGMNPITIYVMQQFVDFSKMGEYFVGGLMKYVGPGPDLVLLAFAMLTFKWLILLYFYRNKTFLRV